MTMVYRNGVTTVETAEEVIIGETDKLKSLICQFQMILLHSTGKIEEVFCKHLILTYRCLWDLLLGYLPCDEKIIADEVKEALEIK